MSRAKQRWLPAVLLPFAVAIAVVFGSVQAGATVSLPPKSADEILAMIARTEVRALSGTVEQNAALGLPELPASAPGTGTGAASAMEFLSGSHTARVYADGPLKARLQVLDHLAERDVVINGSEAWLYNSKDNSATHVTRPAPQMPATEMPGEDPPADGIPTPEAMASRFLAAIDTTTEVTIADGASVAGRSAYSLVLSPRSTGTLVDSVSIAVDSQTGLPLRVEVRAKGQPEPAYSLAYTQLDLSRPDAALFEFTPPQGATVNEKVLPNVQATPAHGGHDHSGQNPGSKVPAVSGQGWDSVLSLPAGSVPAEVTSNPQLSQMLHPVAGGRAVTSSLVSVLILDDGRVYAGMVLLERLQSAAAAQ